MKSIQTMVRESVNRFFDEREYMTFGGQVVTGRDIKEGKARWVRNAKGEQELREWDKSKPPKSKRPICGAKTRAGGTCKARGCIRPDGKVSKRCRLHGGLSTGPKGPMPCPTHTPETRAKIFEAIAMGTTVANVCKHADIAVPTFYLWQKRDPQFKREVLAAFAAAGRPRTYGWGELMNWAGRVDRILAK